MTLIIIYLMLIKGGVMTPNNREPIDLSMLPGLLSFIPADIPREDWARFLMSAKSEFGENAKGVMLEWSATASNFDKNAFNSTWKSIRSDGGVTIATLVHEAKQNGFKFAPMSASDKKRIRTEQRKRHAQRKKQEAIDKEKREQLYAEAKIRANKLLNERAFYSNPQHPYFVNKGINNVLDQLNRVYQFANTLMIPVYHFVGHDSWAVCSLQYIDDKGGKFFLKGGQTKGAFFPVRFNGTSGTIVICEGFATGVTLAAQYEMVADVVCAFNARNLAPVAKAFKQRYPLSRIVVAGDNDRQTELSTGVNVGIVKATEAAKLVDGALMIPEFSQHERGTDWNDRYLLDQAAINTNQGIRGGVV